MTASAIESTFTHESLQAFIASRGEPEWLGQLRRSAWQTFCGLAWPSRRDEEWMRTDIRVFKLDKYAPPQGAAETIPPPRTLLSEGVELAGASSSVNSRPAGCHLKPQWARQGVLFGSLDTLLLEHAELLRPFLSRAVRPDYDKFSALHAAFWSGGQLLYVPRGVVVDEPFHALAALTNGGVDFGHTLVILDEGAEATVLSETASQLPQDEGFHCGATELLLAPGANLRYVQLQDWGQGVWHFAHQQALVQRDASLQWTVAALGCRLSKVNQHVCLVGEGARCQVNGVMFTEGKQHLAYHTLQHHAAAHCQSDFLYKAALQDRSHTVWRGMIQVDPAAQKTNGYQRNDNLLLSTQARADSIPGLEIQADDVRCTHGSTTGKVDEELIFYAMCRGFSRREATRMIVTGFFQQVFDRITIESVRDALGRAIAARVREYE
ncbi:MAG: Fe-S cluster assembly protein SufD [Planctomycetota bacterium]|nr:Fe-S cluster assembly protein SufD [Planctomycetota bacterium]